MLVLSLVLVLVLVLGLESSGVWLLMGAIGAHLRMGRN